MHIVLSGMVHLLTLHGIGFAYVPQIQVTLPFRGLSSYRPDPGRAEAPYASYHVCPGRSRQPNQPGRGRGAGDLIIGVGTPRLQKFNRFQPYPPRPHLDFGAYLSHVLVTKIPSDPVRPVSSSKSGCFACARLCRVTTDDE